MVELSIIGSSDLSDLASLYKELVDKETDIAKMRESLKKIQGDSNYIVLGVRKNGHFVGSAIRIICHDLVGACNPFMVIENVIVSSSARGKGIGRKLMSELESQAIQRKCYYAILVSSSERKRTQNFYNSIGYDSDSYKGFKKYFNKTS